MRLARHIHRPYENRTSEKRTPAEGGNRAGVASGRSRQAGFTVTELMVVLVIIGILAAVATPSFTKDSSARKGREFARMVAQTLQRAHLEAMSSRVPHMVVVWANRLEVFRTDNSTPLRTLYSPSYASNDSPNIAVWDVSTTAAAPSSRALGTDPLEARGQIVFNPMGNAGFTAGAATLANFQVYIRNEALNPQHPDGGFLVSVTGLTSFVSMRNFELSP